MYYLQSRYYDPSIGRFINADNVNLAGANGDFVSYNLFAYCGNNPVSRVDNGGQLWGSAIAVSALIGGLMSAVADVAVQVATTGTVDIGQTMIAAGAGAISGACALIPGGAMVTTAVSGAINGALRAGSYALNQIRQGKQIDAEGLISNTVSGFVGGVVGNLFHYSSTNATREMAEALLDKGVRKIATGVASTIKRGAQYVLRGTNMLINYAQQAGTNSGFGSVVGSIINPFISEAIAAW